MPDWATHERIAARLLGAPRETARRVDMDIDAGPLHDIGRKYPKRRLGGWSLQKELLEKEQLRHLRLVREKLEEDEVYRKLFILHHTIDVLADIEVSRRLLEEKGAKVPLRLVVLKLRGELLPSLERVGISSREVERIIKIVTSRLGLVLSDNGFNKWVEELVELRRRQANQRPLVVMRKVFEKSIRSSAKWQDNLVLGVYKSLARLHGVGITDLETPIRIGRMTVRFSTDGGGGVSCDYLVGRLIFWAHRYSFLASNLFDIFYLTYMMPVELFYTFFLRTTKRRAAGLGRRAVEACKRYRGVKEVAKVVEEYRSILGDNINYINARVLEEAIESYSRLLCESLSVAERLLATIGCKPS